MMSYKIRVKNRYVDRLFKSHDFASFIFRARMNVIGDCFFSFLKFTDFRLFIFKSNNQSNLLHRIGMSSGLHEASQSIEQ